MNDNLTTSVLGPSYALVDSGDLLRLERFGSKTIVRPSSVAVWKRHKPAHDWDSADARFDIEKGWVYAEKPFSAWTVPFGPISLELTLQSNGQVGLFPEHSLYLERARDFLLSIDCGDRPIEILNLFGYTGLATTYLAHCLSTSAPKKEFQITHVDISKRALEWLRANLELNSIPTTRVRTFPDDAVAFLKREARRGRSYDLILVDPPSFSRISKKETWNLEEQVTDLTSSCLSVLSTHGGRMFFTNHSTQATSDMVRNIAYDFFATYRLDTSILPLSIREDAGKRRLPLGSVADIFVTDPKFSG